MDSTAYDDIPPNDDYTKSWSTQRLLIATHEILPHAVNRLYKRVVNYFCEILILLFCRFGLDNLLFFTGSGLLVLDPLVVAPRGRTHWDSHLHLPHPDPSSSQGGGTQSQSVADTHPDP